MPNPFKPTAGATPPVLVGRRDVLDEFQESLDDGPGAPGLLQLLSGARGVGKTVMLTELGNVALANGWVVIHETAGREMLSRIGRQANSAREELSARDPSAASTRWTLKAPLGEVERRNPHQRQECTWAEQLVGLLDVLHPHGTGVCITVDEIHGVESQQLYELATQMQMFIRANRPIALLMAGLPRAVAELLAGEDKPTTFLRRAERPPLDEVAIDDVARAFHATIAEGGRSIEPDLTRRCAEATAGYPFMIQLVGYHVWRQGRSGPVTAEHVLTGIDAARARIGNLVHAPALKDLSDVDRSFLVHMAVDEGPSKVSEVGARMDRGGNYANVYRRRLVDAGIIHPAGHGRVEFAMPFMREYLREHATHLMTGQDR